MGGDDPVPEAGREPFDLSDDRLRGVPCEAVRDVGVGPERVD